MERRSFIKNLVLGAIAAPVAVKAAMSAKTFALAPAQKYNGEFKWVVNPEWENAPYEVVFGTTQKYEPRLLSKDYRGVDFRVDSDPIRLDFNGARVDRLIRQC